MKRETQTRENEMTSSTTLNGHTIFHRTFTDRIFLSLTFNAATLSITISFPHTTDTIRPTTDWAFWDLLMQRYFPG